MPRQIAAWLVGLGLWLMTGPAAAWAEMRLIADDVQVDLDRSGSAVVHHRIRMRIVGGPLRSFDLVGVPKDATPLEDGTVTSAQLEGVVGAPMALEVAARPEGGLRVGIASPRGLSRGIFLFHVRYRRNLLAAGEIRRDGAMLRVRFVSPGWSEGRDNARCTFVLPIGPTEPRPPTLPLRDDDGDREGVGEAGIFISEVKRSADHDEVELVRPHVARDEAVNWSVRIDPRALGDILDARLRPLSAPPPVVAGPSAERRLGYFAAGAVLLMGFSVLVGCKARQVARHARDIAVPRPLIPIGAAPRILLPATPLRSKC